MDSGVFLLHDDNTLTKMIAQSYASESILQRHLENHPDLLAGDQIDPTSPRRWLLIQPEMGVPAGQDGGDWWSLDHLSLDQDAIPTFVEVKRASDTRSRREVVAQMLDYAANATEYWPVDRMREAFGFRCQKAGLDPEAEIAALLGDERDEAAFWDLARSNLAEARIRLLFVADEIPASLRRIVEFLNRHLSPIEVLAVEIRQFASVGPTPLRTLVPRVIGQTEQARTAKGGVRAVNQSEGISHEEFLKAVQAEHRRTAEMIFRIAAAEGFITREMQNAKGQVRAWITMPGVPGSPITLDEGAIWISLGRHHPVLLERAVNQHIRNAILEIAPSLRRRVEDMQKSEVAMPMNLLGPETESKLRELFEIVKTGLLQGNNHSVSLNEVS